MFSQRSGIAKTGAIPVLFLGPGLSPRPGLKASNLLTLTSSHTLSKSPVHAWPFAGTLQTSTCPGECLLLPGTISGAPGSSEPSPEDSYRVAAPYLKEEERREGKKV